MEYNEKIQEGCKKASEFCKKNAGTVKEGCAAMSKMAGVFEKAGTVVDTVAPWLGPIGIGLKVATTFVGIFIGKKQMSVQELGEENLKLNKVILEGVTDILDEVKDLKLYVKYGQDLKKF